MMMEPSLPRLGLVCLLWSCAGLLAHPAYADDVEDEVAPTYAIQNRQYRLGHELSAMIGILPLNAFTKGLTVGGGYAYHFNELWAWEVAQVHYAIGLDTDLKRELIQNFQVQPTQVESIQLVGSSNLVIKPAYGKLAWFKSAVAHVELYFIVGPVFTRYQNPAVFRGGANAGVGLRFHMARHWSLRFDVRDYVILKLPGIANELHLGLSLAASFGGYD